jgi:hypothetical protein
MLEWDYCAVGGDLATIQAASKNIGSEALSAYLFHQASQPDPIDLLGAMFIIEGLGMAKVGGWATRLRASLALTPEQVTFLDYHGEADEGHLDVLRQILRSAAVDRAVGEDFTRSQVAGRVSRTHAMPPPMARQRAGPPRRIAALSSAVVSAASHSAPIATGTQRISADAAASTVGAMHSNSELVQPDRST